MNTDWRTALDELAAAMRELEVRRPEAETLRSEAAAWRRRAEIAETELAVHSARLRLRERFQAGRFDPSLAGTAITFGQSEADAVPVPTGPGSAQFLIGMCDILLENDRPVYFKVERRPVAPVIAVADPAAQDVRGD